MAISDELQQEFEDLDSMDLSPEQYERVQSIKKLAREKGYLKSLPSKTSNPKQEQITGSQEPRIVGIPPGALETAAEAVGGVAGGFLGAPLGPLGSIAGAGLGTTLTRGMVEGGKALAGMRPPITADEAVSSGGAAFLEGAGGELGFRALSAIPGLKQAAQQRLLAGKIAPKELEVYRDAQQRGIHLPPSTLTESKTPKMVEQTLRRTISGGGKFEARDIANEINLRKAVDTWADDALGPHAGGPVEHGLLLQKALTNKALPAFQENTKSLYKHLDELTGGAPIVSTEKVFQELSAVRNSLAKRGDVYRGTVSTLDDVLDRLSKEGPTTGLTVKRIETKAVPPKEIESPILAQTGKPFTTPVPGAEPKLRKLKVAEKSAAEREPVQLTFQDAQSARHIIGEELGSFREPLPGAEKKALSKAYAMLTEEMGKGAMAYSKGTGRDINLQWLMADTMSKRGKELFNESVVAKVIERNPEQAVKTVFQKGAITETRNLMRSLETYPEAQNIYRRGVVHKLIEESTDPSTGRVVGELFAKAARKREETVLKETFGENYKGFSKLLEIAERMPRHDSKAGMLWFEQGLYIAGMTGAVTGHMFDSAAATATAVAAPAGWFIATKRLAEIMTNPQLTNKLLEVRKMSPRSSAAMRTMAQLGAIEIGETGEPMPGRQEPRQGFLTGLAGQVMQ